MRIPASAELIDAWDTAVGLHRLERSTPLLGLVTGRQDAGRLGVAERDRLLVQVHELLFGSVLRAVTACPACGELQVLEIPTADLLETRGDDDLALDYEGYHLRCRTPRAADLVDAAAAGSADSARALLVSRSVVSATRDGVAVSSTDLPAGAVAAAAAALDDADPLAGADSPGGLAV